MTMVGPGPGPPGGAEKETADVGGGDWTSDKICSQNGQDTPRTPPPTKSLGGQQRQGWALLGGGMGSRKAHGPGWRWGGVMSGCVVLIRAGWKMNAHALQWLDGVVVWTTVVPHPRTLRKIHLSPCDTHSPAVDRAGFVIRPNLEMTTLKLRELTGPAQPPLASQCQRSEGS